MPPRRKQPTGRAEQRRWCIPPAILHEPGELLEGSQILDELPGPAALLVWQTLRDVTLWAGTPADRKAGLFTPESARRRVGDLLAAGIEPPLEVPLTTLAALIGAPTAANPEIVSQACLELARWAESRGAMATALAYAQAAALASPQAAAPALAAGQVAQRWQRRQRAETWLRRCVAIARRRNEWETYTRAYVDLGTLYAERGDPILAQRSFLRAIRESRRSGLREVRGAAFHGLLLLALAGGDATAAAQHGRQALRAYGSSHPDTPALLQDLAAVWVRSNQFTRAIQTLRRLLPARVLPLERTQTLALLALAAAGSGNGRLYSDSAEDAWTLITRNPAREHPPIAAALRNLLRAAALIGDWTRMEEAVQLLSDLDHPHLRQ